MTNEAYPQTIISLSLLFLLSLLPSKLVTWTTCQTSHWYCFLLTRVWTRARFLFHLSPPFSMPNFFWNNLEGASFCSQIWICYDEVAHWRRNLFQISFGKVGKTLVKELARLFQAYADSFSIESGALYAAMTMPSLLLQRPSGKYILKTYPNILSIVYPCGCRVISNHY